MNLSRRSFLTTSAAGLLLATASPSVGALASTPMRPAGDAPFTLGVASGEPSRDGFVLWTRLATDPVTADGLGGMGDRTTTVEWQVATDEAFTKVVASGTATTGAPQGHSVHVEVDNLPPNTWFYYRFRALGVVSPVGRTRTAPEASSNQPAKIAVASCSQWEHGWFSAYRDIAEQQPDLVVHLGDYIYEHGPLLYPVLSGRVRSMVGGETFNLADYRRRYALYRTDPDLQRAHAAAPWVTVFDDHEVDNDWAADHHEVWGPIHAFLERRAAAFQAYYENMPLRLRQKPRGPHMELFRRIAWGQLFTLHMLDTRQYRDVQVCRWSGPCDEASDPKRTILGEAQEKWLREGYAQNPATWQILGNQVMFAPYDQDSGPGVNQNMDAWDGYVASRRRVVEGWKAASVTNPVVLTGDYHKAFAFDIPDVDTPKESIGVEVVATSITSEGVGDDSVKYSDSQNPHLRMFQSQRGYSMLTVGSSSMDVAYRTVSDVRKASAALRTSAKLTVRAGERRFS